MKEKCYKKRLPISKKTEAKKYLRKLTRETEVWRKQNKKLILRQKQNHTQFQTKTTQKTNPTERLFQNRSVIFRPEQETIFRPEHEILRQALTTSTIWIKTEQMKRRQPHGLI